MNTKITKKTQYAVAGMLELARSGLSTSVAEIANSQSIERKYMNLILIELRKNRLVESIKGIRGGYKIAKTPDSITISEIMNAVGESIKVTRCKDHENGCIGNGERCASHKMWKNLENSIEHYLNSVTLADILGSHQMQKDFMIRTI